MNDTCKGSEGKLVRIKLRFQDKSEATAFKELAVVNWSGICNTYINL